MAGKKKVDKGATKQVLTPLADEPVEVKKKRAAKILSLLKKSYPDATCALHWSNPLELLVATILSAQCTDQRVNIVAPTLFAKYKTAADYARAPLAEIEAIIQSTGFYHNKAKSMQGACRIIADKHAGQVPRTMEEILELPGVARKTANVVLGTAYGMNEGVVVDTHVGRLAWRLGLTWTGRDSKDPVRIEQDLMQTIPRKDWTLFAHALVLHGRYVCAARKPRCSQCKLAPLCPSALTFDNADADDESDADD
jgi:endonuclease III